MTDGPAPKAQPLRLQPLPWSCCTGRFLRNVEAAATRWPPVAALPEQWAAEQGRFELFRASDGNYQVREHGPAGAAWLPALADHRTQETERPLAHDARALMPLPYAFDGFGHGWYLRRVFDATCRTFLNYSAPILIVERDPLGLALAWHLHDWRDLLADPRIYLFIGPGAARRLEALLLRDDDLPIPGVVVGNRLRSGPGDESLSAIIRRARDRRGKRHRRLLERVRRRYAGRDACHWLARFTAALDGQGPPLGVLSATSRYTTFLQYSMRDVEQALRASGHEVRTLIEPDDHHQIGVGTYLSAILRLDPDLFFSIDHLRPSHEAFVPPELPIFTWDQDLLPHVFTPAGVRAMGLLDAVATVSRIPCVTTLGGDPRRFITAVTPTNPETYSADPVPHVELEPHLCALSYVSNASQTPSQFHAEEREAWTSEVGRRLLDRLFELATEWAAAGHIVCGAFGFHLLPQAESETGIRVKSAAARNRLLSWYLWRLGDRLYRHQALEWAAAWARAGNHRFRLYGRGWEHHPTLAEFACGVARNGQELRCIYQASAINLQLMPAGFLHQRSLDGLAAGGFFIARRCAADFQSVTAAPLLQRWESLRGQGVSAQEMPLDPELGRWIDAHANATGLRFDPANPDHPVYLRCAAEQPCAGQIFPHFGDILFEDRVSFARVADRYLKEVDQRRCVAADMRSVVMNHFTYECYVDRFLRFQRDWLAVRAAEEAKNFR